MPSLTAEARQTFGKKLKNDRRAGKVPVIVYGRKKAAAPFFVDLKQFKKVLKEAGESTLVDFQAGADRLDVLIHDVAWHPVTGEPIHVDFYAVDKDTAIQVPVPLAFAGVSPAVKEMGGILVKVLHELEIEALPRNLPHEIKVDISALTALGSQIHVRDLKLPADIKVMNDPKEVVASIAIAEEEKVEEVAAPIDLTQIEVEKRGKTEAPAEGEAPAEAAPEK